MDIKRTLNWFYKFVFFRSNHFLKVWMLLWLVSEVILFFGNRNWNKKIQHQHVYRLSTCIQVISTKSTICLYAFPVAHCIEFSNPLILFQMSTQFVSMFSFASWNNWTRINRTSKSLNENGGQVAVHLKASKKLGLLWFSVFEFWNAQWRAEWESWTSITYFSWRGTDFGYCARPLSRKLYQVFQSTVWRLLYYADFLQRVRLLLIFGDERNEKWKT